MRGTNQAVDNFDHDEAEGEDYERDVKGFYLKNGGWKGDGWNQVSWRRRKREEQIAFLQEAQRSRQEQDTRKRSTPLGRMEDKSLRAWSDIR